MTDKEQIRTCLHKGREQIFEQRRMYSNKIEFRAAELKTLDKFSEIVYNIIGILRKTAKQPGGDVMTMQLFGQSVLKFLAGLVLVSLLLFLPAGTLHFWNGWLLIGILFIPMCIVGCILMLRNPELLKKRLNVKETERDQKSVIAWSGVMFLLAFVTAGWNYRFQWFVLPDAVIWIAAILFLAAYLLYAEVLRENAYLSRTVEVQQEQKVIDTGLYGIVRHPMYGATLIMFLAMGLVLGSPPSFCILLLYIPVIARRIRNEETVLTGGLEGYESYKQKVRYKVIPFVW